MELSGVDLNLLVALDLLLDERSVRGAARRAHVTPSAMSHTLARLRVLLGDELLVRAGRGMVPTPRAASLEEPVRDLLAAARALLVDAGTFVPSRLQRAFHLVCTDHVSTVLLPRVEALLAEEAPGVDLYVLPLVPASMDDLRTGRADAAIGVFPDAPPEVRRTRLFTDRFVTVARADHPRLGPGALTLEAFLAEQHALVSPRGTPRGTVDGALAARGASRRVARTVPQFLAGVWLAAHSDLLLTVSCRLVAAVADHLALRVWHPPLELDDYALHLTWHPRVDADPEHGWFRGVLHRAAADLPPLPGPGVQGEIPLTRVAAGPARRR